MGKDFKIQDYDIMKESNAMSNVRQFGSGQQSSSNQSQILSALDVLGAKLVRSESERETMRKLLNEALAAQDRLESQLERSQMNIQNRMDQIEREDKGLSQDDKDLIESQKKIAIETKSLVDDNVSRLLKTEDKLRDSLHTIAKLQRRLDLQEQKRMKLQRRIERVENMASDAQNALQAKAMVLLTDQSEAVRHMHHLEAQQVLQSIESSHSYGLPQPADLQDNYKSQATNFMSIVKKNLSSSSSILAVLLALGIGWGMAYSLKPSQKAFMMMPDGQLRQLDLNSGTIKPLEFYTQQNDLKNFSNNEVPTNNINNDIIALETDWITDEIVLETLSDEIKDVSNKESLASGSDKPMTLEITPELTIDRDITLPKEIHALEEKAFAGIPEAQHDIAALYTSGQAGVKQNYERAAFWFKQAAEQGIGNAAYNLGVLYQQGLGQTQDLPRALDWYRRAAQLGHPEAQYNLGIAHIEGVGTRYNPNIAAAFFQQAAFGGIIEAAYNLGLILENGLLGEVRPEDALKWYRAAAEGGSLEAEEAFKTLSKAMDIPEDNAGLLANGQSIGKYIINAKSALSSEDGQRKLFENAQEDISLGTLVPSKNQILVAQVQEQLRKAKLYNGPQDGIVGEGTVNSIKEYQKSQGLDVDGVATQDLLTYMLQKGTN